MKLLRSKEAAAAVDIKTWPTILDTGTVAKMEIVWRVMYLFCYTTIAWLIGCVEHRIKIAVQKL